MLANSIDLCIPQSWDALSQKQLKLLFCLIDLARSQEELKLVFLIRICNLKIIGRQQDSRWLMSLRQKGRNEIFFEIGSSDLASICSRYLDWIDEFPKFPVRLEKIGSRRATAPDLSEISFEDWLILENLYQGYLQTHQDSLVDDMTEALYGKRIALKPYQRISVFYWMASAKEWLARKFPDFFSPSRQTEEAGQPEALASRRQSAEQSYEMQIRALTKGDISKRAMILSTPCHVALSELDAQAREYNELKAKSK